jgi:hypothetical protein
MSLLRDHPRGRGTWKVWTAMLAVVLTQLTPGLGGAHLVALAAELQPSAGKKKVATKKKVKVRALQAEFAPKLYEPDAEEEEEQEDPSIEDMIREEFGDRAEEALRIAHCESRLEPSARSRAGAVGVFQIMPRYHSWRVGEVEDGKDLWDPMTNVRVARNIFDHQGWRPWVCARIVGVRA